MNPTIQNDNVASLVVISVRIQSPLLSCPSQLSHKQHASPTVKSLSLALSLSPPRTSPEVHAPVGWQYMPAWVWLAEDPGRFQRTHTVEKEEEGGTRTSWSETSSSREGAEQSRSSSPALSSHLWGKSAAMDPSYMRHVSVRWRHLLSTNYFIPEFTCRVQTVTHEFIPRVLQMRSKTSPLKRTASILTKSADRLTYRCFSADHRMNHSFFSLFVHFFFFFDFPQLPFLQKCVSLVTANIFFFFLHCG